MLLGLKFSKANNKVRQMKLLVISNNPDRASFRQRIAVHIDTLRANGIDCEVAKLPSGFLARRKLFMRAADFDAVFLHKRRLNLIEAPVFRRHAAKIIYDFDDAVMYKPRAPQSYSFSNSVRFRLTVKLADLVIAGNPYLAELARRLSTTVEVLPTGLDTKAYKLPYKPDSDGKIRLVWIGSQSTLKYLAEIKPALEEIGSHFDNAILRIICDDFFDLQSLPVEKRLWSEQTQGTDLATSDIGLAPLPDNRFTRGKCGFKILQYASAGLPVIASPVGVNTEYVKDNIVGLLATDKSQWIDSISTLIEKPDLRRTMGSAAMAMVKDFDVAVIGKSLCDLISNYIM